MEIERKWMLNGWPPEELGLPLLYEQSMRQGYISVRPTVRIREEAMTGGNTEYVLCIKSGAGLVRKEIEMDISKDKFLELEDLIGLPLIPKVRRTYGLPDGLKLEVNHVDEGLPTEFWYAEIEYPTAEIARRWNCISFRFAYQCRNSFIPIIVISPFSFRRSTSPCCPQEYSSRASPESRQNSTESINSLCFLNSSA